jgi:hypothetical protein
MSGENVKQAIDANKPALDFVDETLRDQVSMVMHALILAMRHARNWAEVLDVADAIRDVEYLRFRPMIREVEIFAASGAPNAQVVPD